MHSSIGSYASDNNWFNTPDRIWLGTPDANNYNTGTSLPRIRNYSKYHLKSAVKKGDLIYEASGGFGITGHIAIVEGIFYDTSKKVFYIRLIEAISAGVCRGVLDDSRADEKGITVLRVTPSTGVNEKKINDAVSFCIDQIGKEWYFDASHDTSTSESNWYCSELAWAAYKNQGIEIEDTPNHTGQVDEPGVTPRDLLSSTYTSSVGFSSSDVSFYDIDTHWAKQYIQFVTGNGIMNGISTHVFAPNTALTRAQALTGLYRIAGSPTSIGSEPFSDVQTNQWFYPTVSWAYSNFIVNGMTTTTFVPDGEVTREQLVTMLYRFASYLGLSTSYSGNLSQYSDASAVGYFAVIPMKWAISKGIITGTTTTTLSPQEVCSRATYATMLYRFITKLM